MSSFLIVLLSFQLSFIPDGNVVNYGTFSKEYEVIDVSNAYSAEFSVDIQLLHILFVRGIYNSVFHALNPDYSYGFSPDHDTFTFIGGIQYKGMEIGYLHRCRHPVFPYQFVEKEKHKETISLLENSYSEVYLKFQSKLEI